ncbi:MAG TPA: glycosyltransferase family 87 protein [Gemmataceae bacterium]|nr:glycosyltransferase family 87 protein [Gemmataceae bacterium]
MERLESQNEDVLIRSSSLSASELYRCWRMRGQRTERARYNTLQWALILWLILAAAVSVRTLFRPNSHTVFPIFATSADHWWSDQSLYQEYPPLDNFRYPPVFALLVTPFNALGLAVGGILWCWVSMAVYVAGLWWFVRDVIPSPWTRQRTGLFLMLGALGALRGLWNAQSNALIVGLLLLAMAALVRALQSDGRSDAGRRWWLAAWLLALPVGLKLTPLPPVLLLCALWPRRLAWRLAVASVVLLLVPFLTRPSLIVLEHYQEWFDHVLETGNVRWLGFRDGWTVWLVLRQFFGGEVGPLPLREPMDSSWYRLVQLVTAAAALVWCLWQRRRAARLELGPRWLVHVTLSMGLAWLMLFGPAVEHATYVFLTPPLAWAVLERRAWPLGRGLIVAAFVLIMILGWGAVSRLLWMWPVLLTTLPAGTALFALWLIGYAQGCKCGFLNRASRSEKTMIPERWPLCLLGEESATIQP